MDILCDDFGGMRPWDHIPYRYGRYGRTRDGSRVDMDASNDQPKAGLDIRIIHERMYMRMSYVEYVYTRRTHTHTHTHVSIISDLS